ncbi:MAG: hypothetical protein ACK40G_03605 [Cytophagaceae bacterium]
MKTNNLKIQYKCIKTPDNKLLKEFKENQIYKGRTFNDLFEVSTEWASHKPTYLLEKKDFEKYFKLITSLEPEIKDKDKTAVG